MAKLFDLLTRFSTIKALVEGESVSTELTEGDSQSGRALLDSVVFLCDKVMVVGVVVLFAGMPLAFGGLMTFDMFDLPKLVFMRVMSLVLVAAWGIKALLKGELTWRRTPLDIPILAFAAANILATIHTVSPNLSIFGEYRRYEGIITILNYLLLYFIAVGIATSSRPKKVGVSSLAKRGGTEQEDEQKTVAHDVNSLPTLELFKLALARIFGRSQEAPSERVGFFDVLVAAQVMAGALVAFYGIAQHAGRDFVLYNPHGPSPVISTYGNKVFLAAYLVMTIPLAVGLFLKSSWGTKIFLGSLIFVQAWALFLTEARGAWVGLLVALAVLAVLLGKRVLRQNAAWLGLVALLILVPGIANRDQIVARFEDVFSNQQTSVQFRFRWWQSTLPLISDNALLGVGISGLEVVFPKYASEEFGRTEGRDTFLDKAHNEFIHFAATTGLLGLGTYLWVLGAFAWFVWQRWKRRSPEEAEGGGDWSYAAPIAAGIVAYLVQNQTSFGVVGISSLFWLMLGFVTAVENREEGRRTLKFSFELERELRILLAILLAVGAIFLGAYSFRLFQADQLYRQAKAQFQSNQLDAALATYRQVLNLESHQSEYWRGLSDVYVEKVKALASQPGGNSSQNKKEWLDAAVGALLKATDHNPAPFHYYFLGEVYLLYDSNWGSQEAYQNFKKAVDLYPYYLYANRDLGTMAYQLQFYDEAIQAFDTVVQLDPTDASAYNYLALSYIQTGDEDQEIVAWQKLLSLDPSQYAAHYYLGAVYEKRGQKEQARKEYEAVLATKPAPGSEEDYKQMSDQANQALSRLKGSP